MIYQQANEHDIHCHERFKEGNKKRGLHPDKIYTDTGYISGAHIKEYRRKGQELMGYIQVDSQKKPKGFKVDDFSFDLKNRIARCPAGQESVRSTLLKDGRTVIAFSQQVCMKCPHVHACVGINTKTKKRVFYLGSDYESIRERRKEQKTERFRKEMRVRAQIEGTISEAVRCMGFRHAKYKRKEGHQFQFYQTGAALNVKRLIKAVVHGKQLRKSSEKLAMAN